MTCTHDRDVGRKKFLGFPKGWKQNSRGSGGHNPSDAEGISHFCTTFIAIVKLLIVVNNLCI